MDSFKGTKLQYINYFIVKMLFFILEYNQGYN